MAVIINDFEVVLDAPATNAGAPAPDTSAPAGSEAPPGQRPMTPLDVDQLQQHLERRRTRLRAH